MDADQDGNIMLEGEVAHARSIRRPMPPDLSFSGKGQMPHAAPPAGLTTEVHNINLLLGAIVIGAQANVQWLKSGQPNLEAAQRTSARLLAQIQNLCEMVDGLRSGQM